MRTTYGALLRSRSVQASLGVPFKRLRLGVGHEDVYGPVQISNDVAVALMTPPVPTRSKIGGGGDVTNLSPFWKEMA